MLKNRTLVMITCVLVAGLVAITNARSNDQLARQILKLVPEADTNGDGVLSEAEEATLSRRALKKHPSADVDGDGVLSDSEKRMLLQKVTGAGLPGGTDNPSETPPSKTEPPRQAPVVSPVRQGPQPIQAAEKGVGREWRCPRSFCVLTSLEIAFGAASKTAILCVIYFHQ